MSPLSDPSDRHVSVVVAVLTYRRQDQIAALVPVLEEQAAHVENRVPGVRVRLLVVDNEAPGTARDVVTAAATSPKTTYVVEEGRGIAAARNRALSEAAADDLLVFIDDDEIPDQGWLLALVNTSRGVGGASVSGPVRSSYDGEIDPWILEGGFLSRDHRRDTRTGDQIDIAATNNLLLDLESVRRADLWFDPSLGLSGGEDTHFTASYTRSGGVIVWCAEAWVTDVRPADRLTRKVAVQRAFSFANSLTRVHLMLENRRLKRFTTRLHLLVGAVARMVSGAGSMLAGLIVRRRPLRANGARLVARGAGAFTALFGFRHEQYG